MEKKVAKDFTIKKGSKATKQGDSCATRWLQGASLSLENDQKYEKYTRASAGIEKCYFLVFFRRLFYNDHHPRAF